MLEFFNDIKKWWPEHEINEMQNDNDSHEMIVEELTFYAFVSIYLAYFGSYDLDELIK